MKRNYGYMGNAYIWQRAEWPHFRWDSNKLIGILTEVANLHGVLIGRMSTLGFESSNNLSLLVMSEELIASSQIEGITLNAESVRSSIGKRLGIKVDGVIADNHYVEGVVDIMMDAVKDCNAPLSAERLCNWHAALFPTGRSGITRITVGDWRQGSEKMQVVSGGMGCEKIHYEAPSSDDVAKEMQTFIHWCNTNDETPWIMSAVAHLWFLSIHPFDDGNGRIARTLSDYFLTRLYNGSRQYYSISAAIMRNKHEYYDILEQTQHSDLDITKWVSWFLHCIKDALEFSLSQTEKILAKSCYWDKYRNIALNDRQHRIINMLWDGFEGKLTTSKYAKICKCSQDTAGRDIATLLDAGMLINGPGAGRNTHYILSTEYPLY